MTLLAIILAFSAGCSSATSAASSLRRAAFLQRGTASHSLPLRAEGQSSGNFISPSRTNLSHPDGASRMEAQTATTQRAYAGAEKRGEPALMLVSRNRTSKRRHRRSEEGSRPRTSKTRGSEKGASDETAKAREPSHKAEVREPLQNALARRPHAGGRPDVVGFGIFVKALYAIDIKQGTFTADVVVTLKWKDPRVANVIPHGHPWVTVSSDVAADMMWIPDVMISNRDRGGVDIISENFNASRTGHVTKVMRALVLLQNSYSVHAFPFDSQTLTVRISSSRLMTEELRLKPLREKVLTGVKEGIFDDKDFSLEDFAAHEVTEVDVLLKKSRGELKLRVKRDPLPYIQNMLVPCLLLLGISYSAFWFPEKNAFAMPKTATVVVSFLSLMTISVRTNQMLPVRGGLAWIDLFEQSCQCLMFMTVCSNLFIQYTLNRGASTPPGTDPKSVALASQMCNEMKVIFPMLALIIFGTCFWKTDGSELDGMSTMINTVLVLCGLAYSAACGWRLHKQPAER